MNFAVIGHPITHSLSPELHNWIFKKLGIDAHYSKVDISREKLAYFLSGVSRSQFQGFNVTLPHKEAVIPLLDNVEEQAEQIGAVNCVVNNDQKLKGYNTDWIGFQRTLQDEDISVRNRACFILGAGGASRAILYTLLKEGADPVLLHNRHQKKALQLQTHMMSHFTSSTIAVISLQELTNFWNEDLILINTTSVGMTSNNSLLPVKYFHRRQTFIDVIYTPLETTLLRQASAVGAKTVNGLAMFIHQGLASIDLWLKQPISQSVNREEIKSYLIRKLQEEIPA